MTVLSTAIFFKHLGARWRRELHLSDVTYGILQALPDFTKDFVRFFWETLPLGQEIHVTREFVLPDGIGQADLVFRTASWWLIVEN